uniref:Retrotransposable element Tf2 n=1 Tax=Tanacetum cinerariifolium TaxID=118510 RepID=A0A699HIS8_TANCI|nr:retrotransposable element Tf2 [Tanacetum cinerariifolium]
MAEKKANHFCFYCDQRYSPRHKCNEKIYCLEVIGCDEIMEDEDCAFSEQEPAHVTKVEEDIMPQVSLNAMNGVNNYKTMRVRGHGKVYEADVIILPLGGCEMVLGIQWLARLRTIQFDFKKLVMEFVVKEQRCMLRGTPQTALQWMQGKHLNKYIIKDKFPILVIEELLDELSGAKEKALGQCCNKKDIPLLILVRLWHQSVKWIPKLSGFDHDISYNMGSENMEANALSRLTSEDGNKCVWEGNVLKRKVKIIMGANEQLRTTIVQHYHADAVGGHSAGESAVEIVDRSLQVRESAIEMIKFHIIRAQNRMKKYADLKSSGMDFDVRMWVYLKLQPHRQVTIRKSVQKKLSAKYDGPFLIIAKVGVMTYKLELPSNMEPEVIMDRKIGKLNNRAATYVLVKWVNHPKEDATWELYEDLVQRVPRYQSSGVKGMEWLTLEDVLSTLNSRELKKRTNAKADGDGLFLKGRSDQRGNHGRGSSRSKSKGFRLLKGVFGIRDNLGFCVDLGFQTFSYRLNPRFTIKECSSCGALYTRDCSCSKGSIEDKILVPKLPKNYARCAKCGHPVNGHYCQGCALV